MEKRRRWLAAPVLVAMDAIFTGLIIARVPYTKIDWEAYMSQVSGFLAGERNYSELKGDTGPLVYPAGFLYVYSAIQCLTGGAVPSAQVLFGLLYVLNLSLVLRIYVKTKVVPWWALVLLCLSKRLHSIFILRLFNDCVAVTLAHASVALFQSRRWLTGMVVFSLAVSIKMNVLLYAPPLLLLLCKALPLGGVVVALSLAALVQIVLGLPFLWSYPSSYVANAFNLGRVFIHFWSVNFKFVPERIFVSKPFAIGLLIAHLGLLLVFAQRRWCMQERGIVNASGIKDWNLKALFITSERRALAPEHIVGVLFTGNFVGIVAARSLHYQFYSWYFYTLPFLLWTTPFPTPLRLLLFILIEAVWNIYPSTGASSMLLLACHLTILWGLYRRVDNKREE